MYFWCLQFSQITNENNSTWGTIVVKSNFFVRFLGELKIPKRNFEINWLLVSQWIILSDPVFNGKVVWSLIWFATRQNLVKSHLCELQIFHHQIFPSLVPSWAPLQLHTLHQSHYTLVNFMKQNLRFRLVLGRLVVLKISAVKLKYAIFEDSFFFIGKRNESIDLLYTQLPGTI